MRFRFSLPLLFLLATATLSAASLPSPANEVDLMADLHNELRYIVNYTSSPMMILGWIFWGFFTLTNSYRALRRGAMEAMTHFHHLHPLAVLMPFFVVLFRSAIAAQMLLWYNVPIPGIGVSFPQLFPDIAQKITNAIDYHALAQVIDEINQVLAMPAPHYWDILGVIGYFAILGVMTLAQSAMTIIDSLSFLFVGMLIFAGPPFVASFIDFRWDKLFWDWFGDMVTYSSYQIFSSILIAVFSGMYLRFFQNIMGGVYTLAGMILQLPYLLLITLTFVIAMFLVPSFTSRRFSGFGALGQEWSNTMQRMAVNALARI